MKCRVLLTLAALAALTALAGCAAAGPERSEPVAEPVSRMELSYAQQFTVDYYEGGYKLITIDESGRYLVVPEGGEAPEGLPEDVTVLYQPLDRIYLVATSAMDLFRSLDAVDAIRLSGTDADGWEIPEARQALESGEMLYAGKYNAPDYELILSEGCDLAVESTMIYHNPEVKEQLERLGVPVLVERSSYEGHPLGRMEWIKLYAALLDREEEAAALYDRMLEELAPILDQEPTGKTVAFFYLTTTGTANVRKSGDYIPKMIRMAGGEYVPSGLTGEDNALSTMNMDLESFYAAARDADVLIYSSTIYGELQTVDQLLQESELLADFKAVQTGDVWCTGKNMFQESMGLGQMILEIHQILTQPEPQGLTYLHRLT